MYIGKNLYDKYARYIDLPDRDFFHHAVSAARDRFELTGGLLNPTKEQIDRFKRSETPVLYCSTVTGQTADDVRLRRIEMNERIVMKYLIIDADFNPGEEEASEAFYQYCVDFATLHMTPLVIYPTVSYPEKPRFRAVFFVKRQLNESSYVQAMRWLTRELNYKTTDQFDFSIRHSNNAPVFTNADQIEKVYDTTQDEDLLPLDNSLWKNEPKPKLPKKVNNQKMTEFDKLKVEDGAIYQGIRDMVAANQFSDYDSFWKFSMSLARAEFFEQLTPEAITECLHLMAENAQTEDERLAWRADNERLYTVNRNRLFKTKSVLAASRPLLSHPHIRDAILNY